MQIEVSARKLEMPMVCACCGDPATEQIPVSSSRTKGKRVVRTETVVWQFPYCAQCMAHVQAFPGPTGCVAGALMLIGLVFLLIATPFGVALLVTAGVVGVLSFVIRSGRMARANSMRKANCVNVEPAVRLLGWSGSVLSFDMDSPGFVLDFAERNQKKLVNLPPATARWLQEGLQQRQLATPLVVEALPIAPKSSQQNIVAIIARLEGAKGPAARRAILASALPEITEPAQRDQLLLEASRIEVEAVLTKVDGLKTAAAKKRNLQAALDEIRSDSVPDDLQVQQIRWLEEALANIDKTGGG